MGEAIIAAGRVFGVHCVVGAAPFDAPGLDWFGGMDPANVKEFGWALEGEGRLTVELTTLEVEERVRVAENPTRVLEEFDLPQADIDILANPLMQQRIRETTEEQCRNGVGGWVDERSGAHTPWGFNVSKLTVPVEIRYGASDVLVPAAHGVWLAEHVPGATVRKVTAQGHLTDPDEAVMHLSRLARSA